MDEGQRIKNGISAKEDEAYREKQANHGNQAEGLDTQDIASTNLNGTQPVIDGTGDGRDEEFAAEMTADEAVDGPLERERNSEESGTQVNSAFGWIALSLSVISFFVWPIILGGAGIILGFVSKRRGSDTLGNVAIAAGAISILITLFILPFV
ncbi:hypothetical protein ACFO3D_11505 [Virgibacillus kekensis]|uniref:DUF4190 domain-containing protein n=1 Tax=Virgibacillus kekensis TaxID=202261 RepID=A0ABV9DKY1_9BACI